MRIVSVFFEFENNTNNFYKRIPKIGVKKVKEKFDWMFERISAENAREIALPMYKKAIKKLDKKVLSQR